MWIYFSIPIIAILIGLVMWVPEWKSVKFREFGRLTVLAGLIGLVFSLGQHYFPRR
jgi:hypothetical protein